MKALVVDDSRVVRILLSQMLKDVGFTEVAQAKDGKEAMAYFGSNTDTRLALVDWNMPEMDGIELVEAVRQNRTLDDVCLMMVTTESEMSQVERALALGANEFVMKPFTKDVITDKLRLLGFGL
jgi:two-component system, chemotaxis family, chemotaxis protein CheY